MAFNKDTNTAAPANNNFEKNDFFLNISLPDGNGGMAALGAIGLKLSKPRQRKLVEWLNKDPAKTEERCAYIVSQMVMNIRSAAPNEDAGFALPE